MRKLILLFVLLISCAEAMHAQLNLLWQELGPTATGGPTMAILVDKRDVTGNTIYAGALGGGLWKSNDAGNYWYQLSCTQGLAVSCITQSNYGDIYFGTGGTEYVSGIRTTFGHVGSGIYSVDANDVVSVIPSTLPLSENGPWLVVQDICVDPFNGNHIIAATILGLYQTYDKVNWQQVYIPNIQGNTAARNVSVNSNASVWAASVGGNDDLALSKDNGATWQLVETSTHPGFPATPGRVVTAFAPGDTNIIYALIASPPSGPAKTLMQSMDKGLTWDTLTFNQYNFAGEQAWFSSCIAVSPAIPSRIYVGGRDVSVFSPPTGPLLVSQHDVPASPNYVHQSVFTIVTNPYQPNTIYLGTEGGIYKCVNAFNNFFTVPQFQPVNRSYNTAALFTVSAGKSGKVFISRDFETLELNSLSIPADVARVNKGWGNAEVSILDDNVVIKAESFGKLTRSINGGQIFSNFLDTFIDPYNLQKPSRCGQFSNEPYFTIYTLVETRNAYNTVDSVWYQATAFLNSGDTVVVSSATNAIPFKWKLQGDLNLGDSIKVPDLVKSRLYMWTSCGLWMADKVIDVNNTKWYKVINAPASFWATTIAATPSGDTLFVGGQSKIIRISGLNGLQLDTLAGSTTALFSADTITRLAFGYVNVSDICVNPNNAAHAIAVISLTDSIPRRMYHTFNGGQTWYPVRGHFKPKVPVYTCIIDRYTGAYIIGAEDGLYTSTDTGFVWQHNIDGFCHAPVYDLQQLPFLSEQCYAIYAATNGRGAWRSFTTTPAGCSVISGLDNLQRGEQSFKAVVFPNPADNTVNVSIQGVEDVTLLITDVTGRTVVNQHSQSGEIQIPVAGLQNGIYMVNARAQGKTFTGKFIVQH